MLCLTKGANPKISKFVDSNTKTELIYCSLEDSSIEAKNMAFKEVADWTNYAFWTAVI